MLGLRTCIYRVSALKKATQWYSKAFAVPPYFDEPYYVGFNIGGYELGLQPEEGSKKGSNIETYWGVCDIKQTYSRMIDMGAIAVSAPMNVGGALMVASIKDPWDNIIGLIYNPDFAVTEIKYEILHDVPIHACKDKVYNAISQPKHLNNWWTKSCEGLVKIESQYQFYFSAEYDWKALVTKEKFGKQIEFTMTQCSEDWEGTKFGFLIIEEEEGCLLSFYHNDWRVNNYNYRRTSYCWAILLNGLKAYVEKDIIIPFEERS